MGLESEYLKCAFDGYLKTKGKSRNWLAQKANIKQQTVNNLCNGSLGSEKIRDRLFECMGTDLFSFLEYGKKIYEKNTGLQKSKQRPIPIDPAVEFLNECIQEAGAGDYLNDKQKQALLKIIRDELNSAEEKAKQDIKKYLNVLKG